MSSRPTESGRVSDRHADAVVDVLAGALEPRLAFQPIVDLEHGQVVGYEALARFGDVRQSPVPFLRASERLRLRPKLESRLLARTLEARRSLPAGKFLSVNLTPDLLFGKSIATQLRTAGDLRGLVLELTEHVPVDDLVLLRRRLDALRQQGALIALDDVGAGWSGLKQLVELRPDILKLDRSLVHLIHEDERRSSLVRLLGRFATQAGDCLLAEGVETEAELRVLLDLDVHLVQGWLTGRPAFAWHQAPAGVRALVAASNARADFAAVPHRPAHTAGSRAPKCADRPVNSRRRPPDQQERTS